MRYPLLFFRRLLCCGVIAFAAFTALAYLSSLFAWILLGNPWLEWGSRAAHIVAVWAWVVAGITAFVVYELTVTEEWELPETEEDA